MSENTLDLRSRLAEAQEELQAARTQIAALEVQLQQAEAHTPQPAFAGDIQLNILDSLLEGCQIIGFDWRYRYLNQSALNHSQQNKSELIGSTMMERYPGIETTPMFAALKRCMTSRVAQQIENHFIYPDGEDAWFELSIQPIPEGIFILSLDISEHKRAELALKKAHEMLEARVFERTAMLQATKDRVEAVLDNSFDGILLMRRDLRIQQANAAFEHLFGCDESAYFDHMLTDFVHPDDAGALRQVVQASTLDQRGEDLEVRACRQNGTIFDAELSFGTIRDGGLVCSIKDITERKAHERQLRFDASVQESVSDAVIVTDMDYVIQSWNTAAERIYGWSADEVIGKVSADVLSTRFESREEHDRIQMDFLQKGRWSGDVIQHQKDGGEIYVQASVNLFKDERAQPLGIVAVNRDITARKHSEQQFHYLAKLLDNVSDAVITTDMDFRILSWNRAAEIMYGWSVEDALGENVLEFLKIRPVRSESLEHGIRNLLRDGVMRGEVIQQRKNGDDIHVLVAINFVKDENDVPTSVIAINHDVTQREKAQALLNAKADEEREFQHYLKTLHDITIELALIDDVDAFYKRAVELGLERFGFERVGLMLYDVESKMMFGTYGTDAQGKLTDEHDVRFDPAALTGILARTMDHAERFLFEEDTELFSDYQSLGRGWNAVALLWDGRESLGWLGVDNAVEHKPVTAPQLDILALYAMTIASLLARKREQDALRASEERYRLLAENINDLIATIDTSGNYTYVSPSWLPRLGYAPEKLIGTSGYALIHPDDLPVLLDRQASALDPDAPSTPMLHRIRHKDGHYIWAETYGQIIWSDDRQSIRGFITTSRDVTDRLEAQAALQRSAEEIHDLYNNAPCGYHSLDADGKYVQINDTELNWLGYLRGEVVNKLYFVDLLTPESKQLLYETFPVFKERGWITDLEFDMICRDGSIMTVMLSATAIYDENGNFIKSRSNVFDMTELKKARMALRDSEERFRLIVDGVRDYAIYMVSRDGIIQSWNPGAEAIKGYRAEEVIGKHFSMFYTPEDQAIGEPQHVLRSAQVDGHYVGEGWRVRKDGSRFWAAVVVSALRDSEGALIGFSKITRDLTERRRAEAILREQHDFLQLVVDNVPDLIVVKDREGRFQLVNQAAAAFGHSNTNDLIGKTDVDLKIGSDEVAAIVRADRTALEGGEPIFIPEEHVRDRFYQTTKIPLKNADGDFDRLLVVASDITKHKIAEQALQEALESEKELSELKSRFVSMASHEFRTPLATILAMTETIIAYRSRLTDEQVEKRLYKIQDQIGHLKDIMEDVLQLARIQARRIEFNPVPLDLDSLCRSVLDEFQSRADVDHQFDYRCDSALHSVLLDKRLVRQIVNNLVSNAVKYSPPDKTVEVHLASIDGSLVLTVRDGGIGIPEDDRKHLFEPFHRASNVGTIAGTGLGLVIIKESVELHGGTIQVDSEVDHGTTFTVTIPLGKEGESEHA